MGRRRRTILGQRFGRLLAVKCIVDGDLTVSRWNCICDCGTSKVVLGKYLIDGGARSCGCLKKTHGRSRTPEWNVWCGMKNRCFNPKTKKFPNYGGRGITVCDRWNKSFEAFFADMGTRPSPKHTIDRIDNDGPYSPENCKWSTQKQQQRNRRDTKTIQFEGKTMLVIELAEKLSLEYNLLRLRLYNGWTLERAIQKGNIRCC